MNDEHNDKISNGNNRLLSRSRFPTTAGRTSSLALQTIEEGTQIRESTPLMEAIFLLHGPAKERTRTLNNIAISHYQAKMSPQNTHIHEIL